MNLIKNSHDAIIEHRIPSGLITIVIEETSKYISIRVSDNGGGISDTVAERLFEPYFSTKAENGTGLGLYMAKSIIEDYYKGTLSFHNTGTGACFTIILPFTQ